MTADQTVTVELEHRVSGSPEIVFEYFTDPEKYRRWHGVTAELDARPGGVYRLLTVPPDVWIEGEYVAVDPPRRIVLTWGWQSSSIELPGCLRQVAPGSSTVEFTFVPDGDATVIRVRHSGLPSELAARGHTLGWDSYLARLAAILEGKDGGEDPALSIATTYYAWDDEPAHTAD
jgi:uncharacterized protein YndB with AHSA1/START domain